MSRTGRMRALAAGAAAGLLLGLATAACTARSLMGEVQVTQQDGLPCFAIPLDDETRSAPVRLQALSVTSGVRTDWRQLPETAWAFRMPAGGALLEVARSPCLRYGAPPAGAEPGAPAEALVARRVYRVEINARPRQGDSPTLGYQASFCIRERDGQPREVIAVPWDERAGRWREDLCTAP